MHRSLRTASLTLVLSPLVLAGARADAGEGHGTDAFVGYSFANLDDVNRQGGGVALGFDLVGPVAGFLDSSLHFGSAAGLDRSDVTVMAGPGLRFGKRGGTVVFARALAGLVRDTESISVLDADISRSSSRLGVMGGGGLDIRIAARWAARVQGDYLWNDAKDGEKTSGFRASAGVVYRFGVAR